MLTVLPMRLGFTDFTLTGKKYSSWVLDYVEFIVRIPHLSRADS
jgi:hypothetical protein